jgi:spermidine synthase
LRQIKLQNFILEITVFTCGGLVMIYEIIGSRILSPFIGTSTYTWTSLIGVILAALSLGYWIGGRWADKKPELKILSMVLFFAGGLVGLTIVLKDLILSYIAESAFPIEIKSVIAATILFAPASVLLGFVSPYAIKIKTKSLEDTGKTAGKLFALSTVGSIIGTFSAGFFLIPFIGSTRTLYFISGTLIILSLFLAPFSISKLKIALLTIFFLGIGANEFFLYFQRNTLNFYDFDTEYSRIQIFETTHKKNGKAIRAMAIDPYIYQSSMYIEDGQPASEYHRFYHLIRHFNPDFKKTLMIGGAGYSFPKQYLKSYPEAFIDVVEIDPRMTALAKRFFNLKENTRMNIFHQDGRVFLNQSPAQQYDVVLIDAFTSLFSVPFQLTTIEAVRGIDRVLKPDGIVIFNIGGAIVGERSKFLKAEINTYQRVFSDIKLFKVDPEKSLGETQNFILTARKNKAIIESDSNDPFINTLLSHSIDFEPDPDIQILTDDLAPVEYYNSFAQKR